MPIVVIIGAAILLTLIFSSKGSAMDKTQNIDSAVNHLADAIARAEGFFVAGSRPARNNNPGNLTLDIGGSASGVHPVGKDGIYTIYATATDGWNELRAQVRMMLDGSSHIYSPNMTISEMSHKYTTTEQTAHAANIARFLGLTPYSRLSEIS